MKKHIKVVWLCNFSNVLIRKHLTFSSSRIDSILRKCTKSTDNIHLVDYGQWITNGIEEMKKYSNVELHVISPHYRLLGKVQQFNIDGVYYHFYDDESYNICWKLITKLGFLKHPKYGRNCRIIDKIINDIAPDLFHIIGAENINYSVFGLKFTKKIPLIVQLQTLVNDPNVYSVLGNKRELVREIETNLLKKADYIYTNALVYISIIRNTIDPEAVILANKIAVGVVINKDKVDKEYDFVYFSANINKAADIAIESFAIAKKKHPRITLDIVGAYSSEYKQQLDKIICEYNLEDSVFFEGLLPTHDDVLKQIKKSKFALLPLRPDILPSTIREAMSVGCPVITSITESTPSLNSKRLSILLSEKGNPESHAANMCRLLEDSALSEELINNAFLTVSERFDNAESIKMTVDSYYACLDHYHNQTPIPTALLAK